MGLQLALFLLTVIVKKEQRKLTGQTISFYIFSCSHDDCQGALRFTPRCLSACQHTLWNSVCVINSSHTFQWIFLKPCILVVDILKLCIWVFNGAKINFDRITAFRTWYGVCVINSSYNFQWIILKPCILVVDLLKLCMLVFDGAKINFDRITAFRT